MLSQLNTARELIRTNPEQYPVLVRNVLPIGDRPETEIRLWCAGFVADFFVSSDVLEDLKLEMIDELLPVLDGWIDDQHGVVSKLGVVVLSHIYHRVYKNVLFKGSELSNQWLLVCDLKKKALARWRENEHEGLVAACIKFAAVVVLAHQQVSPNHQVLDSVMLTAEAAGLCDRLLAAFSGDKPISFNVLSASLNAVVSLALDQPQLAPRIVSYILTFDVSKRSLGTPQQLPLILRWVSKLFKLALHPLTRQFPQINRYLLGLNSWCAQQSLKRRVEDDEASPAKRTKSSSEEKAIEVEMGSGSQPYKALYTIVDSAMTSFHARDLQLSLAVNIVTAGLAKSDSSTLDILLDKIRERLSSTTVMTAELQDKKTAEIEQESQTSQREQQVEPQQVELQQAQLEEENKNIQNPESEIVRGPSRSALDLEVPSGLEEFNAVLNRLLGVAPIRVVARLSARGLGAGTPVKEFCQRKIYSQLVPDFRNSLEPLVLWLSEEYYAEDGRNTYFGLVARVVDELIPKLEVKDSRLFIRLLSELPELNREIIFKMKSTCLDPERSVIGARALKFLIMFKPPCRQDCLDLVEELTSKGVQSVNGILERFKPVSVKAENC